MRFARALLASLGASTCLVLAGTLAMATLSTVVAFSGLPGLRSGDSGSDPIAVLAAAAPASAGGDDAAATLAMPAVPRRRTAPRRPAPVRPALAVAAAGQPSPDRRQPPVDPVVESLPPIDLPPTDLPPADPPPRTPPPPPTAALSPPVREVGTRVGETVATAGNGLAETLAPVSPPAATVVGATGKVAGDTVDAVTEAVAGVLDGLLGR